MHDGYKTLIGFKYWCGALRLVFKMLTYSAEKSRKNANTFLNIVLECSGLLHVVLNSIYNHLFCQVLKIYSEKTKNMYKKHPSSNINKIIEIIVV